MNMVKNIGDKMDVKIKNGDLNEQDLMADASKIIGNMSNIPGMDKMQSMMQGVDMNGLMKGFGNVSDILDPSQKKKKGKKKKGKKKTFLSDDVEKLFD
jgi:formylmethanofuran dehydrogenase subunit A